MVLADHQIDELCWHDSTPMIINYIKEQVNTLLGRKVISYGVSSYGYDFRLGYEVMLFSPHNQTLIDPKNFYENVLVRANIYDDEDSQYVILPPHSFALGHTVESFNIPRDVITICLGKSTYARCGLIINVTPFEPEWSGCPTIELSNTTPLPMKVYIGEGIGQLLFLRGEEPCRISYADKKGKYQNQPEQVTVAK